MSHILKLIRRSISLILAFILSLIVVGIISNKTLNNTEWVLSIQENMNYYSHMQTALEDEFKSLMIQENLSKALVHNLITTDEVKAIIIDRTSEGILYKVNPEKAMTHYNFNIFSERLLNRLEIYEKVSNRAVLNKSEIINNFTNSLTNHFNFNLNSPYLHLQNYPLSIFLLDMLCNNQVISTLICLAIILILIIMFYFRNERMNIFIELSASLILCGFLLFISFMLFHNLVYPTNWQEVNQIQIHFINTIINESFKIIYTAGYYILSSGVFLIIFSFALKYLGHKNKPITYFHL